MEPSTHYISQQSNNVVIVGSGPVGLAVASLLKTRNKGLNITVVDKRPDTTRSHGLQIDADTIDKVVKLLDDELLVTTNEHDRNEIMDLKKIFLGWKGRVVRTNTIENVLTKKANELGVIVLRGNEYEFGADLENENSKLNQLLDEASVIIGADGAHSNVRKIIMDDKLTDEKNLSYLIEFKYQTSSETRRRSLWDSIKLSLKTGSIDFETMGRGSADDKVKPATLHVTVSKSTYDKFRPVDEKGQPKKGIFQNPWTEEEIAELAKTEPKVAKVLKTFRKYEKDVGKRGGTCENIKVTTIPMGVYRSEEVVSKYGDKYVLLAGDASSGVIFGRGVNKGFQEAVICADSVDKFFKRSIKENEIKEFPKELNKYRIKQLKIFSKEKRNAEVKNRAIKTSKVVVKSFANIRRFIIGYRALPAS